MTEAEMIERDKADGDRAAALDEPMLPGVEYHIAKLDLKPGNILVVKVLREGLSPEDMNRMQYNLQKFIGRKVLIILDDVELSVIEGTKVPK